VSFLGRFDLLLLPTRGENFGHVVLEALAAGTPVIVGRDTPWQRVEAAGAGWLCDPASPAQIAGLIERFMALDEDGRQRMREAARRVAAEVLDDPAGAEVNRDMFRALTRGVRA
jgi:glycosyltransferase involved in cell wall biosynthesis